MSTEAQSIPESGESTPFIIMPKWVFQSGISHKAICVYLLIRDLSNAEKGYAWPSRKSMADKLELSTDSVDRAIKELEDVGAVEVEKVFDGKTGRQTSNHYVILSDSPELIAKVQARRGRKSAVPPAAPVPRGRAAKTGHNKELELDLNLDDKEQSSSPPVRARDPYWDAMVTGLNLTPTTPQTQKRFGRCRKLLVEAGASPESILKACENYRKMWPGITLSVEALVKHYDAALQWKPEGTYITATDWDHEAKLSPTDPNYDEDYAREHGFPYGQRGNPLNLLLTSSLPSEQQGLSQSNS